MTCINHTHNHKHPLTHVDATHTLIYLELFLTEMSFSGEVAFIVGGDNTNSVEVYSPEGKCQHKLAPIPNESEGTSFVN